MRGIDQLAEAVKMTLGPNGRNVILERKWGAPMITNDGVAIAKEIELPKSFENMGAQLIKGAATKTNDVTGDGTTTRDRAGAGHCQRRHEERSHRAPTPWPLRPAWTGALPPWWPS